MNSSQLQSKIEKCPSDNYCAKGVRPSEKTVCEGIKGDYKSCENYPNYLNKDITGEMFPSVT